MRYRSFFAAMMSLALLSGLVSMAGPLLLNAWTGIDHGRIFLLLAVLAASLAAEILLIVLREKFSRGYNIDNFKSLLNKYFHLDYDEINSRGPINLLERIAQAVNSIYLYMTGDHIQIWSSALVMAAVLVMAAFKNPVTAAVMLAAVPVNFFGYKLLNKELAGRSEKLQRETADGRQKIISVMEQTDYLKQCGSHDVLLEQLEPALDRLYGSIAEVNIFARCASRVLNSLNFIVQTVTIALVVFQHMSGGAGTVSLILFTVLLPIYFSNLTTITNANLSKRDMRISLDFIKELENRREPDGVMDIDRIEEITLDIGKLSVGGKRLASGISGKFRKGDIVWIQGKSGSGKSTLAKLLPKFREARTVYFNGTDISKIKNSAVRARVNYLSQNVPVIKGTLRENLFLNKAWDAKAEERLKSEPVLRSILETKTMDTVIEEGGANLSGGEKQKLAVARALYDDVDVLILDEITSNIDKESAEEIMARVLNDRNSKITFVISHDPLPADFASKFLVLEAESCWKKLNNDI
jgi:subfamily B ATP-binding cassette protein MsbA